MHGDRQPLCDDTFTLSLEPSQSEIFSLALSAIYTEIMTIIAILSVIKHSYL